MHSITEVVKIKDIFKSPKAVLCLICLALIGLFFILSLANTAQKKDVSPAPSHLVLNKWTDKYNRKKSVCFKSIEASATYHTSLNKLPAYQTKLIIKTDNLRFMLYTNGKIIFDNTGKKFSGYGKQIHIVDISDIRENSELFLYLSPIDKCDSRICSDIILSSKNDFLFDMLCKNVEAICALFLLLCLFVLCTFKALIILIKKKKSAPKTVYLSCCFGLFILIMFLKSELSQLFFGGVFSYLLLYSSINLLPVFATAFFCSLMNLKSKLTNWFCILDIAYSALRIAIFIIFFIPLNNALFISYILIASGIFIPVIQKLCRFFGRASRLFLF